MKLNSEGLNEYMDIVTHMSSQWEELKYDLLNGYLNYDDTDALLKSNFFKAFHDVFVNTCQYFRVPLKRIKYMYRAVNEEKCDYQRLVPKLEYAKEHNRMNPKGTVFLYIGMQHIGYRNDKFRIIKTCINEIRAPKNSYITVCRFKPTTLGKDINVIDICGDPTIPKDQDELHEYLFYKCKEAMLEGRDVTNIVSRVLARVYFNLFSSDQIFKPIDKSIKEEEKLKEYSPFHALANYIQNIGNFGGLIFRSTMNDGKNLVLFNKDFATYIPGTMEVIKN